MFYRETNFELPGDLHDGITHIFATHLANEIIIQIRLNGELDSTYEVSSKGLSGIGQRFLAGHSNSEENFDYESLTNHMADYQVATKLGDSNNTKLHVVCSQIAELYQQVILPNNVDGMGTNSADGVSSRNILITLSSKIWKEDGADDDFMKLVYILQKIKGMYE